MLKKCDGGGDSFICPPDTSPVAVVFSPDFYQASSIQKNSDYIQICQKHDVTELFGKGSSWKTEYDDTLYKVYDWDSNLAGYFFPEYGDIEPKEREDEIIEEMNRTHVEMQEGTLLLPMVKLGLFDNHEGMEIDYVISSLQANSERVTTWKKWIYGNAQLFKIVGAAVHTAREDRNMLSIALGIAAPFKLGEKEVREFLNPLLNKLHEDGLL